LINENLFKRRVLVFGAGRRAACLSELRRRADTRGFRLMGFIAAEGDEVLVDAERLVERPRNLLHWSLRHQVDEIVVAMDDRRLAFPTHEFLECRLGGLSIVELSSFLERETGKLRLAVSSPSNIIFSDSFPISGLREGLARAIDVLVSLGVLALSMPIIVLTATAILIEDGWRAPVLYRQRRVGRYGEPFNVLKFRSMCTNAEQNGAVWAAPNDSRNTRVGCLIRKSRIDELPQLINVLRGEMSLVGPRPERPEFVEQFEQKLPFYRGRHAVRPGITGWAQLCYPYGANEQDALEKLQYDLYYVKNRSVLFDLAIMMQTVEVVLWQKGAR
jgi:sugar transferase (PEP-CTERM system associated)